MDRCSRQWTRKNFVAVAPQKPSLIRDFLPKYKNSLASWHATAFGCLLAVVVFALIGQQYVGNGWVYWGIIILLALLVLGAQTILVLRAVAPVSALTNALAHRRGETTGAPLANPNDPLYEKSGLRPLLQMLYEVESPASETKGETIDLDFATILDSTSLGIIIIGQGGKVTYANKNAPVRRASEDDITIELVFDADPSIEEWLAQCREKAVRSEKTWRRIPNRLVGEDGRKIYDISASYENGGSTEAVIALIERTPDYIEADDELDFIAFAAHELRGPITVIRGYLDTLQDELASRLQGDETILFERLVVSANRLSSYISNILNAAKYDRRHLKVHLREDSVQTIYDSIKDDMESRAASQHRLLSVDIPTTLPTIPADRSSMGEVLSNLIDNAIKYSNEGSVVTLSARQIQNSQIEISVTDNGIGMPANVINNLFHKFYRSHRSRETVAGTGIGLYICKAIVESHGGTISVTSVEGEGSKFSVTLPTYASVADKLKASDNSSEGLMKTSEGWIKNHGSYRG